MAKTIDTLQERIESSCRKRAKVDARAVVSKLPSFDNIKVHATNGARDSSVPVELDSWRLREKIVEGIEATLYIEYVNAECAKVLAAVDQLDELRNEVDNIPRS